MAHYCAMGNEHGQSRPVTHSEVVESQLESTQTAVPREDVGGKPETKRRRYFRNISLIIFVALLLGGYFLLPLPYVIEQPGPTINVLDTYKGTPYLETERKGPHRPTGQLRMVTVSIDGGPGRPVTLSQLLPAWLRSDSDIKPERDVYPKGVTQEQISKMNRIQMESSQESAASAAFEALGEPVSAKISVIEVGDKSDAKGKLQENDEFVAITPKGGGRTEINTAAVLFKTLGKVAPGTAVEVEYNRAGKAQKTVVTTVADPALPGGSLLGIFVKADVKLPAKVKVHLEGIGGPSAGLVFALGLIDRMGKEDLLDGADVAVTGTVSYDGRVGRIGGVPQKMAGAKRDGAKWFLLPSGNCSEATGRIPEGMRVVPVENVDQARKALAIIKGAQKGASDAGLPSCPVQK